jgi:hypothetical protein
MTDAKNDYVGRTLEEPDRQGVINAGLEEIIVIPFVATEHGFGQALGNLQPFPSRTGFKYRSVTVEFVVVAEVIGLPADERARLAEPLDPLCPLIKETVTGADGTELIHHGSKRHRP